MAKSKRARMPKKSSVGEFPPGPMSKPVQVNFSESHKHQVQAAANAAGLSLAAFIRNAAIAASVKAP